MLVELAVFLSRSRKFQDLSFRSLRVLRGTIFNLKLFHLDGLQVLKRKCYIFDIQVYRQKSSRPTFNKKKLCSKCFLVVFMSISVIFTRYFDFRLTQLCGPAIQARSIFMNSSYAHKFFLDESFLKMVTKSQSEMGWYFCIGCSLTVFEFLNSSLVDCQIISVFD